MSGSQDHLDRNMSREKDFAQRDWSPDTRVGGDHLDGNMDHGEALRRMRTAGSISLSPEMFEKLYLSPQNNVKGDLRKTFGNPTPLALVGFLLSLTPLSCDLMGWRGAGEGNGSSGIGAYFFFGGLLMILGSLGEWVVGNTFPFVVFGSFGAFWLTFACVLDPYYGSFTNYAAYSATPDVPASGLNTVGFNASFGFFCLWMGVLCLVYMICALRTNMVFVGIFFTLVLAFGFLTGGYFHNAQGRTALAGKLIVGGGACAFVTCILGWWIFAAILLASLDFPFGLPVGDLSGFIKGATEKKKEKMRDGAVADEENAVAT